MSINERVKELRKFLKLTQNELGDKIGITGSTISDIERGKLPPTDRNISMICEKFNVREVWLREGLGNIFSNKPARSKILEFADYLDKLDKTSFLKLLMESISELSDEQLDQIEDIGKSILHNIKQKESDE